MRPGREKTSEGLETAEVSRTLEPLFTPRAVALIGSVGEGKLGFELLRQMLSGGYRDIVAINPKGQGCRFSARRVRADGREGGGRRVIWLRGGGQQGG